MTRKRIFLLLFFSFLILLFMLLMQPAEILWRREYIDVLFPAGPIAKAQLELLLLIQGIMLLVVIPVFFFIYLFTWFYNADHPRGKYDPDFHDNWFAEIIWWGVPSLIVIAIGYYTYVETHRLDPYKPIEGKNPMVNVQAIALQWNWLFLYPEEGIASLNFLQIPVDAPIAFEITADAPMNSFWIPDLGGQVYAMPMMRTKLHLLASEPGDCRGCSANISGQGFADMHFITRASSLEEYRAWVDEAKKTEGVLSWEKYEEVAKPGVNPPTLYRLEDMALFDQIIDKYMVPKEK